MPTHQETNTSNERLDAYLANLSGIDVRTTRHAAEIAFMCPELTEIRQANLALRGIIGEPFTEELGVTEQTIPEPESDPDPDELASRYWDRAQRVDPKHGAIAGCELQDYFAVSLGRDAAIITESMLAEYEPGTVAHNVAVGLKQYHDQLGVSYVDATRIIINALGAAMPSLQQATSHFQAIHQIDRVQATRLAINEFVVHQVPQHIASIREFQVQAGHTIGGFIDKDSFYSQFRDEAMGNEPDDPLQLTSRDVEGLVNAYTIQTRPYNEQSLSLAADLFYNPRIRATFLQFHETLIMQAVDYLQAHPERATGNMDPFSEIFVPEATADGIELLPNPKLIKAFANNILPAIAEALIVDGKSADELTADHLVLGLERARRSRLFQIHIGQFNKVNEVDDAVALQSFFKSVCPGNTMFMNALIKTLPEIYQNMDSRPSEIQANFGVKT